MAADSEEVAAAEVVAVAEEVALEEIVAEVEVEDMAAQDQEATVVAMEVPEAVVWVVDPVEAAVTVVA